MPKGLPVVVPIILSGDLVDQFDKISHIKGAFLLDSGSSLSKESRYSFAGFNPLHTFSSRGGFITLDDSTVIDNPYKALQRLVRISESANIKETYLPFIGGLVGYISYEWGVRSSEDNPDSNIPDVAFGLYDTILTYDHLEKTAWVSSLGLKADGSSDLNLANQRIEAFLRTLDIKDPRLGLHKALPPLEGRYSIASSLGKDNFIKGFRILKDSMRMPLYAREFVSPTSNDPWNVYKSLRRENQGEFAAFMNMGEFHVLSSSRTQLIKIQDGNVSLKPVKGSRPRGKDSAEEKVLIDQLHHNEQIQTTHRLMVSDVIRNLSTVCLQDSVDANQVAHIETDSRSHHLVSEVSGKKAPLVTPLDCLMAVLPAVSDSEVSNIVASLEKRPRSVYTGTIGFISFNGTAEFNSAFRTMIFKDTIGYLHSGVEVSKTTDAEEAYINTQKSAEHIFNLIG